MEKGQESKAINRRFTQMDTKRNPVKNITAAAQTDREILNQFR